MCRRLQIRDMILARTLKIMSKVELAPRIHQNKLAVRVLKVSGGSRDAIDPTNFLQKDPSFVARLIRYIYTQILRLQETRLEDMQLYILQRFEWKVHVSSLDEWLILHSSIIMSAFTFATTTRKTRSTMSIFESRSPSTDDNVMTASFTKLYRVRLTLSEFSKTSSR